MGEERGKWGEVVGVEKRVGRGIGRRRRKNEEGLSKVRERGSRGVEMKMGKA